MTAMSMMERHIVVMWVRLTMATTACIGILTSSWTMASIPSIPLRTKTDLVLTTSAGQNKLNVYSTFIFKIVEKKKKLSWTVSITQEPRWRTDALVFLQEGPQAAVGLLWCDAVSFTNRSAWQLKTTFYNSGQQNIYCVLVSRRRAD